MMLLTLILLSLSCFPSEYKKVYDQFCASIFVLAVWLTSYQGATAVESILFAGFFLFLLSFLVYSYHSHLSFPPSYACFHPLSYFLSISTPCMYPLSLILFHYPFSPHPPPPTISLSLLFLGPLSLPSLFPLSLTFSLSPHLACVLFALFFFTLSLPPTLSFSDCSP